MPRKASKGSPRFYFTQETEDWIVKYNNTKDSDERNKIFSQHLYFPFYKLAENIINTFKFYHTDVDQIEDLKCDVISMLIQDNKLKLFDPSRGTKAFSYFGTIVKRWLIAYNRKNYNTKISKISLDKCEDYFSSEIKDEDVVELLNLSQFIDIWCNSIESRKSELFEKEQDKLLVDGILTVFRKRKDLDVLGKKALYTYVREITGCETPYLTKVIAVLKKDFYDMLKDYISKGILDLDSDK